MDTPKVLRRNMTTENYKSRMRDVEEVLDNYRENLKDRGVTDEEAVEAFISRERNKMYAEYQSLDRGDTSSHIYHEPSDWQSIADSMKEQENEEDLGMEM